MSRLLAFALALGCAASARADFADHFARRTDIPFDKVPSRGHSRVLVIAIEVSGHPAFDVAALRTFFGSGPGSFGEYFSIASHGLYSVEATVADPVHYDQCPLPADKFPNCDVSRGDANALTPAIDVFRDALTQLHARGVNFADYDVNGPTGARDGTIDGLLLLTNTPFGGIALPVFEFNTGDNLAGGSGGAFVLDGTKIPYVAIGGEAPVLLHEFGHLLGFTDLYDEDLSSGGVDLSLMGNWDYTGKPDLLDAESRMRIGWAPTLDVDHSAVFRLQPAERGGEVLKLGSDPEYFLVENRGPGKSTDGKLTGRGAAILHVDRSKGPTGEQGGFVSRLLHCVDCDLYHPYILNEVSTGGFRWLAQGDFTLMHELFVPGQKLGPDASGQPFSQSHAVASTNRYDGTPTGITIEVLGTDGDALDVAVTLPGGAPSCTAPQPCPAGSVCPDERCPEVGTAPQGGCGSSEGVEVLGLALVGLAMFARRRRG